MPPARRDAATSAMFVALALTWGSSFLFVEVGLRGLSPGQVVWGRLVLGAAALAAVAAVTRSPLPREPRVWGHLLVVALLLCVVPFTLFAWGQTRVSSGVASILNATTPLQTMLVAFVALPQERLTRSRLAGLLIGFCGILVVLAAWDGVGAAVADTAGATAGAGVGAAGSVTAQPVDLTGALACLGATASYGAAFAYLRRFVAWRGLPALTVATVQVGLAAGVMLLATPLVAGTAPVLSGPVVVGMLALGVAGTGLAYVWNTAIVTRWGATDASTVTYLTPLVGVVLGVVVLGESASWNQPVGALVVVLGVLVAQGRLARPSGAPQDHAPDIRART